MSSTVDLLLTLDLCSALKTYIAAIPHPTVIGETLFEVVDYTEDKNLAQALQDLIIIKSRVCLIVPSGDRFEKNIEGRTIRSTRTTSVDFLMADKSYTKGGYEAAFGGPKNIGVVVMKEILLTQLAQQPQLGGLPWCALYPTDGAFLTIAESDAAKTPGRQAYALNCETPSGRIITPILTPRITP